MSTEARCMKNLRIKRKEKGLCTGCGSSRDNKNYILCGSCRDYIYLHREGYKKPKKKPIIIRR